MLSQLKDKLTIDDFREIYQIYGPDGLNRIASQPSTMRRIWNKNLCETDPKTGYSTVHIKDAEGNGCKHCYIMEICLPEFKEQESYTRDLEQQVKELQEKLVEKEENCSSPSNNFYETDVNANNYNEENVTMEKGENETKENLKVKCSMCDKEFNRWETVKKHLNSVHKVQGIKNKIGDVMKGSFICSIENCGKQYQDKKHLQRHITDKHGENQEYSCEYCKKNFTSQSSLKIHRDGRKRGNDGSMGCKKKHELAQTIVFVPEAEFSLIVESRGLGDNTDEGAPLKFNPKDVISCPFCCKTIKKGNIAKHKRKMHPSKMNKDTKDDGLQPAAIKGLDPQDSVQEPNTIENETKGEVGGLNPFKVKIDDRRKICDLSPLKLFDNRAVCNGKIADNIMKKGLEMKRRAATFFKQRYNYNCKLGDPNTGSGLCLWESICWSLVDQNEENTVIETPILRDLQTESSMCLYLKQIVGDAMKNDELLEALQETDPTWTKEKLVIALDEYLCERTWATEIGDHVLEAVPKVLGIDIIYINMKHQKKTDLQDGDQRTMENEWKGDDEMEKALMGLMGKIQGKGSWQEKLKGKKVTGRKPTVVLVYADQHYEYILPDKVALTNFNNWLDEAENILPEKVKLQTLEAKECSGLEQTEGTEEFTDKKFTEEIEECTDNAHIDGDENFTGNVQAKEPKESTSNTRTEEKAGHRSHEALFNRMITKITDLGRVVKLKAFEKLMKEAEMKSERDWQFIENQRKGEDSVRDMWQDYITMKTGYKVMSKGLQRQVEIKDKTTWNDYTLVLESKIYPALRKQLAEMDPPHKLCDLIDFRKTAEGNTVRLTEEHCFWIIRETAETRNNPVASKKHVCDAIQHFIRAIQNHATNCINTQFKGDDLLLSSCYANYERLLQKMKSPSNVLRLMCNEVRSPIGENKERMPVEEVLSRWSQSEEREKLLETLEEVYNRVTTGGIPSSSEYLNIQQFVQEELQVSGRNVCEFFFSILCCYNHTDKTLKWCKN